MSPSQLHIDTTLGPVGALVTGVDLSQPVSEPILDQIKQAWYLHHVLFFPNQTLTPHSTGRVRREIWRARCLSIHEGGGLP